MGCCELFVRCFVLCDGGVVYCIACYVLRCVVCDVSVSCCMMYLYCVMYLHCLLCV